MSDVVKNIPMNVTSKKNLGFSRPGTDIVSAPYEVSVYVKPGCDAEKEPETYVFFDIETEDGKFAWAINGADLLSLNNNPVDEDNNRLVQDEGWVVTIPAKKGKEPYFALL